MSALGSEKTADIVQMRTALYRHYDADEALLYVGISLSPLARTGQHAQDAVWFDQVAKISIEWHQNRSEAHKAERMAIQSERPKFNSIMYNVRAQKEVMSKDSMIKLRISQAEKDAWEASAKREGMTLSQYVRWIVGPVVGTGKQ